MKTETIVDTRRVAEYVLDIIRQNILTRLLDYCKTRVVEVGLTTKALVGEISLYSNSTVYRKSISRIKVLLFKYVLKRIPYLALANSEFLTIINREEFQVNLKTDETVDDFLYVDWDLLGHKKTEIPTDYDICSSSRLTDLIVNTHPRVIVLNRYARYLNYLFRKNYIPMFAIIENSIIFNQSILYDIREKISKVENNEKPSRDLKSQKIPFIITSQIKFQFVTWRSLDNTRYNRVVDGNEQDDSFFSDETNWNMASILGNSNSRLRYNGVSHKYSLEKFFLHLDKAPKILSTLSRKAYYENTAYSFRSGTDS